MVRNTNQDNYIITKFSEKTCLCVVCDGMGGANGGETASKLAAETFTETVREFITPFVGKKDKGFSVNDVKKVMKKALMLANDAVYEMSRTVPSLRGMGTTLVAVVSQVTEGMKFSLFGLPIANTGLAVGSIAVLFVIGFVLFCYADKLNKARVAV